MIIQCIECARNNEDVSSNCCYCDTKLVRPEHIIGDSKPYILHAEGKVPIVELELDGKNGLRVMWQGPHQVTVEMKTGDGKWVELPGIQKIEVIFDCTEVLPTVKINQIIIPGVQKKLTSFAVDELKDGVDSPFEE